MIVRAVLFVLDDALIDFVGFKRRVVSAAAGVVLFLCL
jgi:hypothetical protein